MSKYLCAIQLIDDFGIQMTHITVSRKDYFQEYQCVQDSYSRTDLVELHEIMYEFGMYEIMESVYEFEGTPEEAEELLDAHPLFEFSQVFQDFCDSFAEEEEEGDLDVSVDSLVISPTILSIDEFVNLQKKSVKKLPDPPKNPFEVDFD